MKRALHESGFGGSRPSLPESGYRSNTLRVLNPGEWMLVALNKPYGVLCQFSGGEGRPTLRDCVDEALSKNWIESPSGLIPAPPAWRDI